METKITTVRSYKDLKVWQKSMELVRFVYQVTNNFPKEETYGLTSQVRRCAISVPSNLAEGSSRNSTKEFIRFLNIAYGSLSELETQFYIADSLKFINNDIVLSLEKQTSEIGKMLNGLRNSLKKQTEL